MKFNIKFGTDVGDLLNKQLATVVDRATAIILPKVTALIVDRASILADTRLNTMADLYKRELAAPSVVSVVGKQVHVKLQSTIAVALEEGASAFDIKAKMLAHATKFGKKGPYIDVPFDWGAGHGLLKAKAMSDASRQALNQAATAAKINRSAAGGRSFTRELRFGSTMVKTAVHHVAPLTQGMRRPNGPKSAKRLTIRRISAASAATSWWHPGFRGVHILRDVLTDVNLDLQAIITDAYRTLGVTVRFT
jgi:hypothetical protein